MDKINQQFDKLMPFWVDKLPAGGELIRQTVTHFDQDKLCKIWNCKQYVNFRETEHCQVITMLW